MYRCLILLVSVALLAAFIGVKTGVVRPGEFGFTFRTEVNSGYTSLRQDLITVRAWVAHAPRAARNFLLDARSDLQALEADAMAEAGNAARRISELIPTS